MVRTLFLSIFLLQSYQFYRTIISANEKKIFVYSVPKTSAIEFFNGEKQILFTDSLLINDDKKIGWSSSLKQHLFSNVIAYYNQDNIRNSIYRPYNKQFLYFDKIFTHRRGRFPIIYPDNKSELENIVICVSGIGSNKPFHALMSNIIPCLDILEKTQCFPFYIYSEDGLHRQENITGWALIHFCKHYQDATITKWDIFYYVYGLLHNEEYRIKYATNLRRELPRIPYAPDLETFRAYSQAGQQLAELHLNYEQHSEYPLTRVYAPDQSHNWEVQKMKLNKDKTAIIYNDWLTLSGIPKDTFEYRLGNRSALEWVIEQYQIKTDSRSGIINDPNRYDDPQYIVRLLGQVIQISVETVKLVKGLPPLLV